MLVVGLASMTIAPLNTTHLVIAYGEEDIVVGNGNTGSDGVKQVAWMVDVDTDGTDDPSDDSISISGGNQTPFAADSPTPEADVTQVAVGGTLFKGRLPQEPQLRSLGRSAR